MQNENKQVTKPKTSNISMKLHRKEFMRDILLRTHVQLITTVDFQPVSNSN